MKLSLILLLFILINCVDINGHDGSDCFRECSKNDRPRICHYDFTLEYFQAMGVGCGNCGNGILEDCFNQGCIPADGIERGVMSINRRIPGPQITVCKNDIIVVDVTNKMGGTATSIHWHGFSQKETPHMDGVSFVTQCPVLFSTTFRYEFNATEAGTQFYHAHAGHHKTNGVYGAVVVYEPKENIVHRDLYDYDLPAHIIVGSDWMHEMAEMYVPGLPTKSVGINPVNFLFNGLGRFTNTTFPTKTPLAVFYVQQGKRYRFRIINSASHTCMWKLQIVNHQMTIISSDSHDVVPEVIDTLYSSSGERYDFILSANQQISDYLIRMKVYGLCERFNLKQYAILRYNNEETSVNDPQPNDSQFIEKRSLNNPDTKCTNSTENSLCITNLESYSNDITITKNPDYQFVLRFDNHQVFDVLNFGYDHFLNNAGTNSLVGGINNLSFTFPSFSVLTQSEEINNETFCDVNTIPAYCLNRTICQCTHRLKVPLEALVEIIIKDINQIARGMNHPFHLHGHPFYVVKTGVVSNENEITYADVLDEVKSGQRTLVLKDTVVVPETGFAVLRFKTDNPGFWLLHCHYEWHLGVGMGLIFQVGETNEMVKAPTNFPKCGNYLPKLARLYYTHN